MTRVAEITIDDAGRLLVRPDGEAFDQIYRAAMEVHWDATLGCLYSPEPREWTYFDWYRQIVAAVQAEYGRGLLVDADTFWTNVPDDVRHSIEAHC